MGLFTKQVTVQQPSIKRRVAWFAVRAASVGTFRLTRWTIRRGFTYRRTLAPLYATIAVAVLVTALAHAKNGVPTMATICLAAAAGVAWRLRRRGGGIYRRLWTHRATPSGRRTIYAWATWAAVSSWAICATAAGLGNVPARSTGAIIAIAAAGLWWWHHRIRHVAEPDIPEQQIIWDDFVNVQGGSLAGAELTELNVTDEDNWTGVIVLPRGKKTTKHAVAAAGDIASAYVQPAGAVLVEPLPDKRNNLARLIITNDNPTHATHLYDESWQGLDNGCFKFCIYPDGKIGRLRLFQSMSGPKATLISGDTGAGKTRGMEVHVDQAAATGLVVPMFGEVQHGQGLPSWCGEDGPARYVATGDEEIVDYLHGIEVGMDERSRYLAQRPWKDEDGFTWHGLDFFDPYLVPELPMLGFYLPEAHDIFKGNEYVTNLASRISKKMRKTGIYFVFDTQYPDTQELGGSMTLRQQCLAGNIVSYRNSAKTAGGMILPSEVPQPHEIEPLLPDGEPSSGTAIVYGTGTARRTYSRTVFVKKAHWWAREVAKKIPPLDDLTAEAFGNKITARQTRRAEDAAERERQQQAAPAGQQPRETITVTAPVPLPTTGTTIERASAYLASHPVGQATTGAIAAAIDASLSAVSTALGREIKRDDPRIHQPRPGVWATTGARRQMEKVA